MLFINRFYLLGLLLIFPVIAWGQDSIDGKRLHDEHCLQCHTPEIYTRDNRIVNNYDELQKRVRQCELANELAWFDEDVNAVIDYLNTAFYKFEPE